MRGLGLVWLPPSLRVLVLSMLPVSELRGAIPLGLYYGLDPAYTYVVAVIGNMIPVVPLLLFLGPVSDYLRRWWIFDRFFTWLFERTRRNHSERYERWGSLALTLFVAIPLPVTGAWTGCAAAFVFGIRFWKALPAVLAGVLVSGTVVTLASLGVISLWFI